MRCGGSNGDKGQGWSKLGNYANCRYQAITRFEGVLSDMAIFRQPRSPQTEEKVP
jgi:hypothetical protein